MVIKLGVKDLISIRDLTPVEIKGILVFALELKEKQERGEPHPVLAGRTLGIIFAKPSTRTRVSFEVGMFQLGGHALYLGTGDLQLGRGETIADTAQTLSRYLDGIMIRTFSHKEVLDLASNASIPVINGLTDLLHPCQVLADLLTVAEHLGLDLGNPDFRGKKIAYVGDGNNVANSWVYAAAKTGLELVVCPPGGHEPDAGVLREGLKLSRDTGARISVECDRGKALAGADIIYTDVWTSMGQEEAAEERRQRFRPYQVNTELLKLAKPEAKVMHCLPAHRGEEITDEVIDGPQSIVFDQAENRLHVQKAILALLMSV